jgi:hypothetical protein
VINAFDLVVLSRCGGAVDVYAQGHTIVDKNYI